MGDFVTVKIRLKPHQALDLKNLAGLLKVRPRELVRVGHLMLTRAVEYLTPHVPPEAEEASIREALRNLEAVFEINSAAAHHEVFLRLAAACESEMPEYRRILTGPTGPAGGTSERPPALLAQEEAIQRYNAEVLELAVMTVQYVLGPGAAREIHRTVAGDAGRIGPTPATLGLIDAACARIKAHLRDSFRPDREAH